MNSHIHQLQGMLESNSQEDPDYQNKTQSRRPPADVVHRSPLDDHSLETLVSSGGSTSGPTPAFLSKLWQLVNDEKNNGLVSWSSNGRSFIVHDQVKFSKEILPNYFKHQKMNSFIRQLNMYGFKKVPKLHEGTLNTIETDQIEFANDFFIKDQPDLIGRIKRKDTKRQMTPTPKVQSSIDNDQLAKLLHELSEQQKQTHRDFDQLKEENQDLWRQVGSLKKKHDKQQDTVQRLITFMIHFIQQAQDKGQPPRTALKRPADGPLMLTEGKRMTVEEYSPNVQSSSNSGSVVLHPPPSPLSEAIKRSKITLTPDDQYLIKANSGNTIMSSDPSAPIISEILPDEPHSTKHDVVNDNEVYYELEPTDPESKPQIEKLKRSVSRQDTTLSSIMGIMNQTGVIEGNDLYFGDEGLNFDDFTAG